MDDSDDDTPERLADLAESDERVRVVHRPPGNRPGGLGGAVLEGFAATAADVLVVMDADFQHPPEVLPELIDAIMQGRPADVVVATRYRGAGSAAGLDGRARLLASRGCRLLVHALLPRTRASSDPLGGFFAVRRSVVSNGAVRPNGYKILLDILVRGNWTDLREIEYAFRPRLAGASKSGVAEARRFLAHVRELRTAGTTRRRSPVPSQRSPQTAARSSLGILVFTSEVAPVVSGVATSMGNLSRGLAALGHRVDVVSRADFPRLVHREMRLSAFALAWPRFRRRLAHYDLVNVHGPVPTMSEAFLLLARTIRRDRRPAIVYTHHSDLAIPRFGWACRRYNAIHRRVAHLADAILVSSTEYQQKLRASRGAPVEIIPWGIDLGRVVDRPPRDTGRLRVLFVGQLRAYKGVRVLVDAAEGLPNVSVTIIGDGPERRLLADRARRGGTSNVSLRGRVSDAELWRAYSEHDVIVLPSLTTAEAYGLVLVEGMAAGCVAVASDLPGVHELISSCGLLEPPGDVEALRDALKRLATDDVLLDRLAAECRARAAEMSVAEATARHDEIFRRIVEQRALALRRLPGSSWSDPAPMLAAIADRIGLPRTNASLVETGETGIGGRVFKPGGTVLNVDDAAVARCVTKLRHPVLVGPDDTTATALKQVLHQPDVTSAILVPLGRIRRADSVLCLTTGVDEPVVLGPDQLESVVNLLRGRTGRHPARHARPRRG